MKIIKIICLLIASTNLLIAQEEISDRGMADTKHETLFSRTRVMGGFGGPIISFSEIDGEVTPFAGGGGGLIIDNFFIGLYGSGSTRVGNFREDNILVVKETANLAHGGLWLGYTMNQFKLIHLFSSLKLGSGAIVYTLNDGNDPWDIEYQDADQIFAVVPEVGLEINIFRFFKIAFTGGYRWVNGVNQNDTRNYSNNDFSSATGSISFRFGGFGRPRY